MSPLGFLSLHLSIPGLHGTLLRIQLKEELHRGIKEALEVIKVIKQLPDLLLWRLSWLDVNAKKIAGAAVMWRKKKMLIEMDSICLFPSNCNDAIK